MKPSTGYTQAKVMLKEFFGEDFKIAEADIKEALDWRCSFALFLMGCSNTMTNISCMEDLENTAFVDKLPYKLKESWRKSGCDLQEKK